LGSHSVRKYAATHVRRCGVSKDEKDIRGRWKGKGRVSDFDKDIELPYPDAKVAEKLCVGRPCFYLIRENNGTCDASVLKTFILTNIVPNLCQKVPESTAFVFGKAGLWLLYSPAADSFCIPTEYSSRIKGLLSGLREMEEGGDDLNPILQVLVLVTGDEGTVYIDVLPQEVEGEEQRLLMGGFGSGNHGIQNQMLAIQSAVNSVRRETIDIRSEMWEINLIMTRQFGILNWNIRRVALQATQRGVVTQRGVAVQMQARLVGDIAKLWQGWRCFTRPCSDELHLRRCNPVSFVTKSF
jgi:hypothetical protein